MVGLSRGTCEGSSENRFADIGVGPKDLVDSQLLEQQGHQAASGRNRSVHTGDTLAIQVKLNIHCLRVQHILKLGPLYELDTW